jgi:hypothetical protein
MTDTNKILFIIDCFLALLNGMLFAIVKEQANDFRSKKNKMSTLTIVNALFILFMATFITMSIIEFKRIKYADHNRNNSRSVHAPTLY